MRPWTRLTRRRHLSCPPPVHVQACALPGGVLRPVIIRALPQSARERLEVSRTNAMRDMWGLTRRVKRIRDQLGSTSQPGCSASWPVAWPEYPPRRGGLGAEETPAGQTQGIQCLRGNTHCHQHLDSHPQPHSRAGHRAVAGGTEAAVPAPNLQAPPTWGPPRRQSSPPRSCRL
ncbi:hypothetical protein GWK47_043034 [Chionoecetes opilio]|uniref:Uncharacterized protein n=1 Tax=Chionoecetes opilio TaxID=41210 RepID=A0A8J4Y9P6_CHIOP|nr:hypothetical protein GWK47_043034 [Chionoecetes opilio]